MSEQQSNNKGFWAGIGKIAVLLGAIWVTIQIVDRIWVRADNITATGEYATFERPDHIYDAIREKDREINEEAIENFLPKKMEDRDLVADAISKFLSGKQRERETDLDRLHSISSFWKFSIENNGYREVSDLKLELPFKGSYQIKRLGEPISNSSFDQVIPLGNIRPSNEISVLVWGDSFVGDSERTRITYPNGVISISYPTTISGFNAWFNNHLLEPLLLFTLIIFPFIILPIIISKRAAAKYEREYENNTSIVNNDKEVKPPK